MVNTDPMRHPFTASFEPLGGAEEPHDGAPPPADPAAGDETGPAEENLPSYPHQSDRSDQGLADRLRVDPGRGDVKG